ncbi:hypothetical protein JCM10908_001846 [Rhodotorula pacifica]|uniref:uncharacterized protein n=1 Tax=Rhodotorula pacifica TaxID=1495444 RepID=UPI0031793120
MGCSSCAAQLLPTDYPAALHILADNQAVVTDPINARPSPGQSTRLAIRHLLEELSETHLEARIVVTWVPGHVGVEGNEKADDLAKGAVQEVGARIKALEGRRKRAEGARRAKRALAYRYELDEGCTSDGSSEEEDDDGARAGLGHFPATQPAISSSPPSDSTGRIRHGRLLPRSVSACWASFKAAQQLAWLSLWSSSLTGGGLRAVTSSPPGLSFACYHASLSRRQSTLLTRLRTGACDLGAYRAHFEPDRLLCACGGEPETREHYFLHCPLYAHQRGNLLSSLRLKTLPTISYLLGDPGATKATLRFLADSGRFDSLFCPPTDNSLPPRDNTEATSLGQRTKEKKKETNRRRIR